MKFTRVQFSTVYVVETDGLIDPMKILSPTTIVPKRTRELKLVSRSFNGRIYSVIYDRKTDTLFIQEDIQ